MRVDKQALLGEGWDSVPVQSAVCRQARSPAATLTQTGVLYTIEAMNAPADENKPEDLGDQIEEVVDEVAEAVDEGVEDVEKLGHAMDDAVEEFAEDNPVAYRIFMWIFTLVLLIVVAWLCARYYGGQAEIGP